MMSLVVEVLLTVPPGGASLTHISQADGNSEGGAGVCVYMRECVWEQKMEMWGVAFEETLQLLCAGMRETGSCFFFCFYLFCIFFLIQITQFLVCYSYCPHTWCVHFWLLPKWGKHVWLLMSTTNIYWYRLNQLTAFYRRPHVRHILKGHLDHLTSQSCYTVGGQFHKGSTQLSHRYNSRYNTYYYHYPQSHLGSNRMHVTGLCHQDTKEGHFCGNVSEQMYN